MSDTRTNSPAGAFESQDLVGQAGNRGDRARFQQLVQRWKRDTLFTSSLTEMCIHPAYQQIIGMGRSAVPLLLEELQRSPDHWFWALSAITGEDPVQPGSHGQVTQMTEDWLKWGRENGWITCNPVNSKGISPNWPALLIG